MNLILKVSQVLVVLDVHNVSLVFITSQVSDAFPSVVVIFKEA